MKLFVIISLFALAAAAGCTLGYILRRTREPRPTALLLAAAIPIGGGLGYALLEEGKPGSWIVFFVVCWLVGQGLYQICQGMSQKAVGGDAAVCLAKTSNRAKLAAVALISCIVNCGFFPIVNFNPDSPVDLGTTMRWLIALMALGVHKEAGTLEAQAFPNQPVILAWAANAILVSGGLLCRYLFEFGEVSNAYYFTMPNILFHMAVFASAASIAFALEKRKTGSRL